MTMSRWETREQPDAVEAWAAEIRRAGAPALGAPSLSVEPYAVTLSA